MFELNETRAEIQNYNPRVEKHGDENVSAGDLKIEVTCHNGVLDQFDPGLKPMLYRKPESGEQQDLDLPGSDGLTARRLPHLQPLSWDEKFSGYKLTIVPGMGLTDDIDLHQVDLSHFKFEVMDGGSVAISFRASFHPEPGQAGLLCELIQDTVTLTLTPPALDDEQEEQQTSFEDAA